MKNLLNWFGLKCKLQLCGCIPKSDDKGMWGECVNCDKKTGYISREMMRSYIELQEAIRKHKNLSKD